MRIFKKKKPVISKTVKAENKSISSEEVLSDKSGSIWVRTNKGLYRTGKKIVKI